MSQSELFNASLVLDRNIDAGREGKLAYIASDATLTYGDLYSRVNRMGHALRALGVRREQRVLLVLDDTSTFPVAFLGALRIGAVPVPVSTVETQENFRHFVEDSYAEVVICDADLLVTLSSGLAGNDVRFVARGGFDGATELDALLACQDDGLDAVATRRDDVAFWLYSSGSTGKPKGVVHRHGSMEFTYETFARDVLAIDEDDVIFSTTKLYHAYGLGNSLSFPLYSGATAVLLDGPRKPEGLLQTVRDHRPTVYCSVPALYSLLVDDDEADGSFDSVRLCLSAAEPLPGAIFERWLERFGLSIVDGIGSTEMLHIYCSNRPGETKPGTVGRPVPGYELRLTDESGVVLRDARVGNLEVRGASRASFYWHQQEKTSQGMRGDWFVTGDRFERHADGTYAYLGRADEMLKVGGLWISPIDMENVLLEHPAVAGVGVVSTTVDHASRIAAVVECALGRTGDAALAEELRAWCRERMREHESPHLVSFVESLPRTANGKIQRFMLHALIAREVGTEDREEQRESTREQLNLELGVEELAQELQGRPEHKRKGLMLELVCLETARLLGHGSASAIDPGCAFKELGFDSLTGAKLRNRLARLTGLRLPRTLVFDAPTPSALADYLYSKSLGIESGANVHARALTTTWSNEPIAIVGMGCRYPGGVCSPQGLWDLVAGGVDAIAAFPADRGWDLNGLFDKDPGRIGTSYACEGGFLYDAAQFDAQFFGISPREALSMDPQQRLLLEVGWEAIESAYIDPRSLRGSQTGVFVGVMYHDYAAGVRGGALSNLEGYRVTGTAGSVVSGRLAYSFGFEGPAVSIDTACSSSLVSLHLACQALRGSECSLALAGGVTVLSTPDVFVEFSRQRGLASDGRCKAFAEAADGAGFAEGVGVLLLERLSEAIRNEHRVMAVICGSAVNQDGGSNGLTAPNASAQQRVIAQALANARLSPDDVDVVEAHGTGTTLGDPIEAQALLAAYGQGRRRRQRLWLGSVKSNIGHTQAAAGVAGVIKMVKALEYGILPRTLHSDEPSSRIDWSAGAVSLLRKDVPWGPNGRTRRAGVSSFGVSGTNAHLILEEAPTWDDADGKEGSAVEGERLLTDGIVLPWVLSARENSALRAHAGRLTQHLEWHTAADMNDVGFSLSTRSAFEHRAVVLNGGCEREGLLAGLRALADGESTAQVIEGLAGGGERDVVFLFGGQGSQWEGMALELYETSPVFAESMQRCAAALGPHVDWILEDVLRGAPGAPGLDRVDVVQPALFAMMVSLAELWRSFGVRPSVVAGHSQGEIAAACVAGALSLDDAARVVASRGRALTSLAGRGGMVFVALGIAPLESRLKAWKTRIEIAAINSPSSVVVSGELDELEKLIELCEAESIRARMIPVDYAGHSEQIDGIRKELLAACAPITPRVGELPFYSSVTSGLFDPRELDGKYWYRNLRDTVRFEEVTRLLLEQGYRAFVEVSPHPVLTTGVQETIEEALGDYRDTLVIGSLRREHGGAERFLTSLSEAWVGGMEVDWRKLFDDSGADHVPLPTYAFQRRRYWLQASTGSTDLVSIGQTSPDHPLLGAAMALADGRGWLFTGRISLHAHPWLSDHVVLGKMLLPGTAFVELALRAGGEVGTEMLHELTLQAPLVLTEKWATQLQIIVSEPNEAGSRSIDIYSRIAESDDVEHGWTHHASGVLVPEDTTTQAAAVAERVALLEGSWPPEAAEPIDVTDFYDHLSEYGFYHGPAFETLRSAWRRGDEIFADILLAEDQQAQAGEFVVHPALLDGGLHALLLRSGVLGGRQVVGNVRLPFSFGSVFVRCSGRSSLRVCLSPAEGEAVSLVATDEAGELVAAVGSIHTREVSPEQLAENPGIHRESLFALKWTPVQVPSAPSVSVGAWPLDDRADVPRVALVDLRDRTTFGSSDLPGAASAVVNLALSTVQTWLADERFSTSRLVFVTRDAVGVSTKGTLAGLASAGIWGLIRSVQQEHPSRLLLVDLDAHETSSQTLSRILAAMAAGSLNETQLAVREGCVLAPRLERLGSAALAVPEGDWRLDLGAEGTLEGLSLVPIVDVDKKLGAGQVRIAVRAGGLNFRDVLAAVGMLHLTEAQVGEGAGVVTEVGPGVARFAVGDPVMGLLADGLGSISVTDHRFLARIPHRWSFACAASVPIAFLTAYYGLVDLAELGAGERLLVHAGAGGVGMAAIQLAKHRGAEVFATSSPGKWQALRALGLDDAHIASSRTLEFREHFLDQTRGHGMDVILNSLSGEFVNASLDLLPSGGRFVELGKTDIRASDEMSGDYPGVIYRACDLMEAGPDRLQQILRAISDLFEHDALEPLPSAVWDVRQAPEAFRFMSQAHHVGKIVMNLPSRMSDSQGTVLITGGTGMLGALVAKHLVTKRGVRHLLLASRSGPDADGAQELQTELAELGTEVRIVACDVSQRHEIEALIGSVGERSPLVGVVHAAGVLDDGVVEALTAERVDRVFAPKVDAAWYLHELTERLDLRVFALFSSAAGVLGSPGQGNYAAANAFLDALAQYRRAKGLAGSALAWGQWAKSSGMTGHLRDADLARLARSGMGELSGEQGIELFDSAVTASEALTIPMQLQLGSLRALARDGNSSPLFRDLIRARIGRATDDSGPKRSLAQRLAKAGEGEREDLVLELVRNETAVVLGHISPDVIQARLKFKDLGLDSLAAVELRNRLNAATGLLLSTTVIFEHSTPVALAECLVRELCPLTSNGSAVERAEASASNAIRAMSIEDLVNKALGRTDSQSRAQVDSHR